jgi:hypothetical protein
MYFHPSVAVGMCGEVAVGEEVWLDAAENALTVRDVDRPVEVADSELEDVTKSNELEVFGSGFNVEEGVEEDIVVKEVDWLVDVDDEVEDTTKLEELEVFSSEFNVEEGEEEDVDGAVDETIGVVDRDCAEVTDKVFGTVVRVVELEDNARTEVYDEIEDVEIDFDEGLDEDRKELDELKVESPDGVEVRVDVAGGEEELDITEYKFSLRPAPQSSNGFPAHLIIRLAPYVPQTVIFKIQEYVPGGARLCFGAKWTTKSYLLKITIRNRGGNTSKSQSVSTKALILSEVT